MIRLGILIFSAYFAIFAQSMDFSAGAGYAQFANNPVGYLGYGTDNVPPMPSSPRAVRALFSASA